jgi:SAM-dependent methyltransferase
MKDHYKKQAKTYTDFSEASFSWKYIEKPSIISELKLIKQKDSKILEAGCGNGRIIKLLKSQGIPEKNITGFDTSRALLKIAKQNFPKAKFVHTDLAGKKAFPSGSYDIIISILALQYLNMKQSERAFENFFHYLKPKGLLLYMLPHPTRMVVGNLKSYFKRRGMQFDSPWGDKTFYFHKTFADYLIEALNAGFEIKNVIEPEISKSAPKNAPDYKKYSSFPSRILITARKI